MAVWVTDASGRISYFSRRAEELLGRRAEECVGRRCHVVIGGLAPSGLPHCAADCPIVRLGRRGAEIAPFELSIPLTCGGPRWVEVIAIPTRTGRSARSRIVHFARAAEPARRAESFLRTLAERTPRAAATAGARRADALTPREREILDLLARDETLYAIALRLGIRHTTVRNHVQHILAKRGAHSILEAVAAHLLETGG
jgi:DNA-binding CsgD family transcriptional regulator